MMVFVYMILYDVFCFFVNTSTVENMDLRYMMKHVVFLIIASTLGVVEVLSLFYQGTFRKKRLLERIWNMD